MRLRRLIAIMAVVALVLPGFVAAPVAAQGEACFAETGQCIRGRFLAYWQQNGGLARNGFPLTGERRELLEDGREYTVQYFERVRLEYHPENAPPYDVLLGQFGRRIGPSQPPVELLPSQVYFPETGHNLGGRFLAYWQANGGLAQFGFPIGEVSEQGLEDGRTYPVQYFERARFEYHPENPPPYDVLLGQFGRQILAENDFIAEPFRRLYVTRRAELPLGPPLEPAVTAVASFQTFERGAMLYRADLRRIYVLCADAPGGDSGQQLGDQGDRGQRYYADTWEPGQPAGGGPAPVAGRKRPARGFGKVWRENENVRACLGFATAAEETGYTLTFQQFSTGALLTTPTPAVGYALYATRPRSALFQAYRLR
jgi:hypothetical protein